jgi:hypothetical protein
MLAHIKAGQVISEYNEGKGRVTFGNGSTVSPPTAGVYGDEQYGFEQLVPIVVVTVDNSTTARTTSTSVDTVEADRVLRTVTISDMAIEDIRAGTFLTRRAFCLALAVAGILPTAEAIDAAKGNWPATFASALAGLSDAEKVAAQIEWATAQNVQRTHPLLAMLAGPDAANLSPAQVDALFGIG